MVLTAFGAWMGFRSAQSDATREAAIEQPAASAPQQPPTAPQPDSMTLPEPPPSTPSEAEAPPPPQESDAKASRADRESSTDEIRAVLDGWAKAHRSGRPREVASFYAPRVTQYLRRRNVSNSEVARAVGDSIVRHGVPSIFRLSQVSITPSGDDKAVVTFRKHWQSRGPRGFAGEEEERLTMVRNGGRWQIASEEELRVHWRHPLR